MLFEKRLRDGIADGSITLALRRWTKPQAKPGGRYRTGAGMVEVTAVEVVAPDHLTAADARRAGFDSVADLLASVRGDDEVPLHKLTLVRVDEPDPRAALASTATLTDDERSVLDTKLAAMDSRAEEPWTRRVLMEIAAAPGRRAADIATDVGLPRDELKIRIRRLKALGLTISLETGYEISPRGAAYLDRRTHR